MGRRRVVVEVPYLEVRDGGCIRDYVCGGGG